MFSFISNHSGKHARRVFFAFARHVLLPAAGLVLLTLCVACAASGPGENGAASAAAQKDRNTLTVLCVDFPEYDWTRSIIGAANSSQPASASQDKNAKKIVVQLLNTVGADMHSYQPTIADMVKIANCDLLIYNGGASQFWVEDALKAYPNPDRQVLSLMRLFESEPDRFPTYVQDEDEHEHEEHAHSHGEHDHEDETDEHLWLSLKMSREFCRATASQLAALNPTAAAAYQANAAAYIKKLDALDGKITKLVRQSTCKTLIFADRYPFKYFCDDYGLAHEAAFPGCSAETEASFETIISLADDLKALPKSRLVTLDGGSAALAETITRAAELPETQIVTLYSMQSLPQTVRALRESGKIQNEREVTYLYLMEQNYESLARLLS